MGKKWAANDIRQSFIDFFKDKGHIPVPSSSLIPGGDQTLLFTNAGMVQFKDVFLGIDHRPYRRAVDSQKCMRVAGKHNDLDDVGRDDSHHTFFEMLGNWSFGDYYKEEAISWAWELLTVVWGINPESLWTTCFKDEKGEIAPDEEAAIYWRKQPGINPDHVMFFGRKDNFWEMADTGPCGPCSEIHIDLGPDYCDKRNQTGHECRVNGNCSRFLELWNLVFIQYNRLNVKELEPLPERHVDTGMGFERIVRVLQKVASNYRTDLLLSLIDVVQSLTGDTDQQRDDNFTPYRVIADHTRASVFLIADGVVPGNTGRNYVCRMIIRRAARFASKIGLDEPFMAKVAVEVINGYGQAYPELVKHRSAILDSITREEIRFQRTVEAGIDHLQDLITELTASGGNVLDGDKTFDLYATHGLPLEITRDIAREQNLDVDEEGFRKAMEEHRILSGSGKLFGSMGGEDVDFYRSILENLILDGELPQSGVSYDPYAKLESKNKILAIIKNGSVATSAEEGEQVEIILPHTQFYVESGGQVSDEGSLTSIGQTGSEVKIIGMRKPTSGVIIHIGHVTKGSFQVGDVVVAQVDMQRRKDIMRNHTATHLLHAELQNILGAHARQAGSLVSPVHLRFDFTHSEGLSHDQLMQIEKGVNRAIYFDLPVSVKTKSLAQAIGEGATALFGEKYEDIVRTITIGEGKPYSYELCGGTHVQETGDIGIFLITSEGSTAAGVRRIEAVTGREAYELIKKRFDSLRSTAGLMNSSLDEVPFKAEILLDELERSYKNINKLRQELVSVEFKKRLESVGKVSDIPVLSAILQNASMENLRQMTDLFRQKYTSGVVALASVVDGKPVIVVAVTDDLVKRGFHAGDLSKIIAQKIDGSGGGRPNLAQAGGKDPNHLEEALDTVSSYIKTKIS